MYTLSASFFKSFRVLVIDFSAVLLYHGSILMGWEGTDLGRLSVWIALDLGMGLRPRERRDGRRKRRNREGCAQLNTIGRKTQDTIIL